jgi:hypothetical protein
MTSAVTPQSNHFGFTRINAGEAFSKNGWAFSDADRVKLDDLLYALSTHKHTGEPALGDPTNAPTFVAVSTGGHLPAATTFYYRASFVDVFGLETAASPEGSVSTPNPIGPPSAPAATVETSAGTITPGVYSYLVTYYDPYGGETTPSPVNNVQVATGTTNRIRLDFGGLPTGVTGIRVYRSRPGQSQFYYLGTLTSGSFYDDGSAEDQTVTVPRVNTTNAANSIEVTIPLDFIPLGCVAWRIYRATSSGGYDGNSLVHNVVEGFTDDSIVPRTTWIDTGDVLTAGFPQNKSATIGGGEHLDLGELSGTLPLSVIPRGTRVLNVYKAGVVADGDIISVTESPTDIKPVRLTAFFKTPPDMGTTVTIHITGDAATPASVDLVCYPPGASPLDPDGYYHIEWPLAEALLRYFSDTGYLTVSSGADIGLITDQVSDTGQSMLLHVNGSWGELNVDTLDFGHYTAYAALRTNEGTTSANDVTISVIRLDTNAVIATQTYTVTNEIGFAEPAGLAFIAPGNCQVAIRVTKSTSATQTYEVEYVRYATTVPRLAAGLLTFAAEVSGGTTAAADANIALWF